MSAGRLYRAIRRLAPRENPAARGVVRGQVGPGRYLVSIAGADYEVPAVGEASAGPGELVAVVVDARTGQPIGLLGRINP